MDFSPNTSSYKWFFYLGIFLVVSNLLIYSINLNTLSYFGILLIYLGYFKVPMYNWVFVILWIFVALDIISTISTTITSVKKISELANDPNFK